MNSVRNSVISISDRRPENALESLERLTGLKWGTMPISQLVKQSGGK
ncbi:hypothetical protein [Marinobacter sp.]